MKKLRGEEKRPVDKVEIYDNNVRIMHANGTGKTRNKPILGTNL